MDSTTDVVTVAGEQLPDENDDNVQPNINRPQGAVVDGEAEESDDEIFMSSSFKISGTQISPTSPYRKPTRQNTSSISSNRSDFSKTESILVKKLCDRNVQLWKHLTNLTNSTIHSASKQIISADQSLLKSQVTIQSTSALIKQISKNSKEILDRYNYLKSEDFIPVINVNK